MIARLLVAFGAVAAAVGFTVFGMATSYVEFHDDYARISYLLMGGGAIAAIIGIFWYRANERRLVELAEARAAAQQRQGQR
ncbi:MAG TPA: hypothetical protein VIL01_09520 [Thermomicrobiales bacterium]|jgi:hypothetical protein